MAKSKATHKGECQICGRVQKLPGGRLSQHGYTVQWSMFNGVCPGSQELPYEQSCDLIKARMPFVERQIADMVKYHSNLLQPSTEPTAHMRIYSSITYTYLWVKATLSEPTKKNETIGYEWREVVATYTEGGKEQIKKLGFSDFGQDDTLIDIATKLNGKYAIQYYKNIVATESYLKWCQDRVVKWEEKELQTI